MKKLLSLLLVLALLLCSVGLLASCSQDKKGSNSPPSDNGGENNNPGSSIKTEFIVPEFRDYERGSVDFNKLEYKRPAFAEIIAEFDAACLTIEDNLIPFDEQIEILDGLASAQESIVSMQALATIYLYKDTSSSIWADQYEYISSNYSSVSQATERVFVACAKSPHKESFEEYFGFSLDGYIDGGIYSDRLVELLEIEAQQVAQHTSLSTATVEITYKGETDTVDTLIAKYAVGSNATRIKALLLENYQVKCDALTKSIYIDLLKTRRLIADELGIESYAQLAYDNLGHDYSIEQMMDFFGTIKNTIYPAYVTLNSRVLNSYLNANRVGTGTHIEITNRLYYLYQYVDSDLFDIYSYLLQHGLYDIAPEEENRYGGAFCTYIDSNNSPFLFASMSQTHTDYLTLSHEFGHFVDSYVNNSSNSSVSLDLLEVYSNAMEFITLTQLDKLMSDSNYKYLEYYQISQAFITILDQSLLSVFEHMAYALPYEEINEDNLLRLMKEASVYVFGHELDGLDDVSIMLIPHLIQSPFYVQSYVTSIVAAMEIFFAEVDNEGAGLDIFWALVDRGDTDLSFEEYLANAGIASPFRENALLDLSNNIFKLILGTTFFKQENNDLSAA